MTQRGGALSVVTMKNFRFTSANLVLLALTAVVSLAAGHLTDLGDQLLGSGSPSTPALTGDVVGLIACAISVRYGMRHLARSRRC